MPKGWIVAYRDLGYLRIDMKGMPVVLHRVSKRRFIIPKGFQLEIFLHNLSRFARMNITIKEKKGMIETKPRKINSMSIMPVFKPFCYLSEFCPVFLGLISMWIY